MNFVLELEKVFKVKLNNKDIISREFRSIDGLISVIHKKLS